jgi:hypothetical protein
MDDRMKRAIVLIAALVFFGGLFTTGSQVSAADSCESVYQLTVNGTDAISFTFYNDNGRYEAVAAGAGGWWVGDYRTGALSFVNAIRYYDGNGNTARARNNGNGTVTIQTADGNTVRSGSLTVDGGGSNGSVLVDFDEEFAIQLREWWEAKRKSYQDSSWATCSF